jgi:hypothetical protein
MESVGPVAFAQERSRGDFPAAGGDQHGINHRFIIMVSAILVIVIVCYCILVIIIFLSLS